MTRGPSRPSARPGPRGRHIADLELAEHVLIWGLRSLAPASTPGSRIAPLFARVFPPGDLPEALHAMRTLADHLAFAPAPLDHLTLTGDEERLLGLMWAAQAGAEAVTAALAPQTLSPGPAGGMAARVLAHLLAEVAMGLPQPVSHESRRDLARQSLPGVELTARLTSGERLFVRCLRQWIETAQAGGCALAAVSATVARHDAPATIAAAVGHLVLVLDAALSRSLMLHRSCCVRLSSDERRLTAALALSGAPEALSPLVPAATVRSLAPVFDQIRGALLGAGLGLPRRRALEMPSAAWGTGG